MNEEDCDKIDLLQDEMTGLEGQFLDLRSLGEGPTDEIMMALNVLTDLIALVNNEIERHIQEQVELQNGE